MRQAEPKLAVSDEQYPLLRPCGQGEIARVAARPISSDSAGLCNPVAHAFFCDFYRPITFARVRNRWCFMIFHMFYFACSKDFRSSIIKAGRLCVQCRFWFVRFYQEAEEEE